MQDLDWKEAYLIDEEVVDKEHKALFEIAKEAFNVVDPSHRTEKIKDVIHRLYDYTKIHFDHEEDVMRMYGYPRLAEHQEQHLSIVEALHAFIKRLPQMKIVETERELAHFVEAGLVYHILHHDMLIKEWVQRRKGLAESVAWKRLYMSGNTGLDRELEELFRLLSVTFETTAPERKRVQDQQTSKIFCLAVQTHIERKELQMKALDYPDLDAERVKHEVMLDEMDTFLEGVPQLEMGDLEITLAASAHRWLVREIVTENRRWARWMKKNANESVEDPDDVYEL